MATEPLSDEEALALIRRFDTGDFETDEEVSVIIARLEEHYFEISDLIFHHRPSLTAEEILAKAKARKAIPLPPT